jgi:hypothetical protein
MRVSALEGIEFLLSSGNHPGSIQLGEVMAFGCVSSGLMIFTAMVIMLARREVVTVCSNHSEQMGVSSGKTQIIIGHSNLKSLP